MTIAILLGILAGFGFASGVVMTRVALDKTKSSNELGALVTLVVAGIVGLIIAFITQVEFDFGFNVLRSLIIIGIFAPGLTQLSYFITIRTVGPSRAGILIGLAPIWAVLGSLLFGDAKLNLAIILGTLIAFLAGILLVSESLKGKLPLIGIIAGLYTGLGFGARDVVNDKLLNEESINPALASGILWLAGAIPILLYMGYKKFAESRKDETGGVNKVESCLSKNLDLKVRLKNLGYLAIPGVIVGFALPSLFEALKRGRLEIVTPIANSFAVISGVILASIIIGRQEWSTKIIISMLLIAGGAVLVGTLG